MKTVIKKLKALRLYFVSKRSEQLVCDACKNEKQTPTSMEVEIIEVFKGKEKRKSIIVYGDIGNLCRPYLSGFGIGKFYIIAFGPGLDGSNGFTHPDEKLSDYSISICGEYWLNVDIENKFASGSVADNQKQITLTDLKTKLNTR